MSTAYAAAVLTLLPVWAMRVAAILERFRGTPVAVSLTIPSFLPVNACRITQLAELGVKELLLACDDLDDLEDTLPLPDVGISFR